MCSIELAIALGAVIGAVITWGVPQVLGDAEKRARKADICLAEAFLAAMATRRAGPLHLPMADVERQREELAAGKERLVKVVRRHGKTKVPLWVVRVETVAKE